MMSGFDTQVCASIRYERDERETHVDSMCHSGRISIDEFGVILCTTSDKSMKTIALV